MAGWHNVRQVIGDMRIEQAAVDLRAMDWRLDALTVMPVRQL